MPRYRFALKDVLRAMVAEGGRAIGNHQIRSTLGSELVSPVYFALRELSAEGFVEPGGRDLSEGVPVKEWSITAAGRAFLEAPSRVDILSRFLAWPRRYGPRRFARRRDASRAIEN